MTKRLLVRVIAIALLAMASIGTALSAAPAPVAAQTTAVEPGDPLVMAHYYIWFDPSSWNRAKIDYPALGRYSSDSPAAMRRHIELAKSVGIDGFIVSWKSTAVLDQRLEQLITIAEELEFSLAMTYQALDFNREPLPVDRIEEDLDRFIANYAESPVFDLFERPLVVLTGTWKFTVDDLAQISASRRDDVMILATEKDVEGYRRVAELVDGDLYYWSSVNPQTNGEHSPKLAAMGAEVRARGGVWIAPAAPGFDARLVGGTSVVERQEGETLRLSWQAALGSLPDAIGIISWNEFSENTHIEPSLEHGTTALEVVADLTGAPVPGAIDFDSSAPPGRADQPYGPALAIGFFVAVLLLSLAAIRRRSKRDDTDVGYESDDIDANEPDASIAPG